MRLRLYQARHLIIRWVLRGLFYLLAALYLTGLWFAVKWTIERGGEIGATAIALGFAAIIGYLLCLLFRMTHWGSHIVLPYGPIAGIAMGKWFLIGGPRNWKHEELVLIQALMKSDDVLRREAVEKCVARGQEILPIAYYHSRIEGETNRAAIEEIIDRVHPMGLIGGIAEDLNDVDPHAAWQMCKILRDKGPAAAPAINALITYLRNNEAMGHDAGDALEAIGATAYAPLMGIVCDRGLSLAPRFDASCSVVALLKYEAEAKVYIPHAREAFLKLANDDAENADVRETFAGWLEQEEIFKVEGSARGDLSESVGEC